MPPRLLINRRIAQQQQGSEWRRFIMRLAIVAVLQLVLICCVTSAQSSPSQYFPDAQIVLDMVILSDAIYHLRNKVQSCHETQSSNKTSLNNWFHDSNGRSNDANETQDIYQLLLPEGTECLHYSHDYSIGTQVLIVRSSLRKYVAVAYAGTDDWKTAVRDGDVLTSDFGPDPADDVDDTAFRGAPEGVRVHRGFNSAVFDNGGFRAVSDCVSSARSGGSCDGDGGAAGDANEWPSETPYRLFTTGHSLGAADSVLLGAALHLAHPNEVVRSINFGCPKVGNAKWSSWMDSLQPDGGGRAVSRADGDGDGDGEDGGSFEIFRFVNKIDLVARLPALLTFTHAGHTLHMSVGGGIKAYYDHSGNDDLGYAGVPFGWEAAPYALLPFALVSHMSSHYVDYLTRYQPGQPNSNSSNLTALYYVSDFERAKDLLRVSSYA